MVEKLIRRGICHEIHRYAKANNKYMKNYDKKKESLYLMCLDANNLYGWEMPQKWPANGFKWTRSTSKFNKDFIKNYDENSNKGYILEVDIEIYRFYQKEWQLKNATSFFEIFVIKKYKLVT